MEGGFRREISARGSDKLGWACDQDVDRIEVWAVSCLCLHLMQLDIPQAKLITFPDKMDSLGQMTTLTDSHVQ